MTLRARNKLIAFSSILAVAVGVALALPPSSSAPAEADSQHEVQTSESDTAAAQDTDLAATSSTVESDPACTDENGKPLPTVSNPCMAEAVSKRAQALTCDSIAGSSAPSEDDRRWYGANCVDDDYVVESENDHGVVISYAGSTFYLGKDCDVRSAKFGRGRWEWANGGWLMIFENGRELGFARRDAPMDEEACRS